MIPKSGHRFSDRSCPRKEDHASSSRRSLALAVALLPSAAVAHAGHDHGTKAKKLKKPKPKKGAAEFVAPRSADLLNQNGPVPLTTMDEATPRVTTLTPPCPECSQTMRLVGVERDDTQDADAHLLTFECPQGHYAAVRFPRPN